VLLATKYDPEIDRHYQLLFLVESENVDKEAIQHTAAYTRCI